MRILGITIPDNKQLQYGLTAIYGIGLSRAQSILDKVGVSYTTKATEVSTDTEPIVSSLFNKSNIHNNKINKKFIYLYLYFY